MSFCKGLSEYDSPFVCTFVDNNASFFYITVIMKYITLILLFILLFCGISIAQETASAIAMGTFSVASSLTATKLADLIFGDLVTGINTTVQPTDAQAAQFLINGSGNTVVQVTITFPNELTCGSSTMKFYTLVPIYNTIPNAMSAIQFTSSSGGSANTGLDGNLYVWAGGRITADKNQTAGKYAGIIELVVTQP
jgi:hypothetical protein